ncbi:alpha/beta hydrolase [Pseudomonas chlororaphis subsp. aurantiaca]|uniref:alpha/beta hydrolase n=1 Tax=Pseudomonas chlororaphis TaxID=587753 RepID=UPI0027DC6134|nr:alpha/beta hydrolase [Pseudomonas chlororaphis]WMI97314.1 alpha/beta hydrolase [Pseudomonas chlororaphis subsp. aurantiaca]
MTKTAIRSDVQTFLDLWNASPLARMEDLPVGQVRALIGRARAAAPPVTHDLAIVRDFAADVSGRSLGMRFYDARAERSPGPLVIYYHGGGFVLGDLESHHALCVALAEQLDLPVVAVDYRLAPESPWPAAPDDAEAAARWLAAHGRDALGREIAALVLAGDSAGANLAAVVAHRLRDRPATIPVAAQFLSYPCVDSAGGTRSRKEFADGLYLTGACIDWFYNQYAAPAGDPRFDLLRFDQAGMPPTVLVTAGLDPLRDEGRAYAGALIAAGVPVTYQEVSGNIHGCFSMVAEIPSTAEDIRRATAALRATIAATSLF